MPVLAKRYQAPWGTCRNWSNGALGSRFDLFHSKFSRDCSEPVCERHDDELGCLGECNSIAYAICRGNMNCATMLMEKGRFLLERTFYAQVVGKDSISPLNRRAILIAAQNESPECYLSVLLAIQKAVVDAKRSSWRGVIRTRK